MTAPLTTRQLERVRRAALVIAVAMLLCLPVLPLQIRDVTIVLGIVGVLFVPIVLLTAVMLIITGGILVAVRTLRSLASPRLVTLSYLFAVLLLLQPGTLGQLFVSMPDGMLRAGGVPPLASSLYTILLVVSAMAFIELLGRLQAAVGGPARLGRADRVLAFAWLITVGASHLLELISWGMRGSTQAWAGWETVVFVGSSVVALTQLVLICWLFARVMSLRKWLARVVRGDHCPQCRYELRGAPDSGCPECGWRRAA